jgi:hypothetical protein
VVEKHGAGLVGPAAVHRDSLGERHGRLARDEVGILVFELDIVELTQVFDERDQVCEIVAGARVVDRRRVIENVGLVVDVGDAVRLAGDAAEKTRRAGAAVGAATADGPAGDGVLQLVARTEIDGQFDNLGLRPCDEVVVDAQLDAEDVARERAHPLDDRRRRCVGGQAPDPRRGHGDV